MSAAVRPPVAILLLLISMCSIPVGAAVAKSLFPVLGPVGVSALRLAFAAVIVGAVLRPWRAWPNRRAWPLVLAYGAALGVMNLVFYMAIGRIPLGVAVALEFAGPLSLALVSARRPLDFLWVALAIGGLALIASQALRGVDGIDLVGALLALTAGGCWALYIVFGQKAGDAHGATTAAWGMLIAALLVLPIGVIHTGAALFAPALLPAALGVALLSSAVPYTLEMMALRALPAGTFGVLLSIEPAFAALSGLVVLGERLSLLQCVAVALIIAASAGASLTVKPRASPALEG